MPYAIQAMMMNSRTTNTLKRRRSYDHGDSPVERVFHAPPGREMPATPQVPFPPSTDREQILEQAAQFLGVSVYQLLQFAQPHKQLPSVIEQAAASLGTPVASLLELSDQHRHKRPRVNPTVSMPPQFAPYQAGNHDHVEVDHGQQYESEATQMVPYRTLAAAPEPAPSILGLNSAGIADCLSSFAACNPCVGYGSQDENYTPMTTTAPYEYNGGSQLVVVDAISTPTTLVPSQTSDYHAFATAAAEVPGLLGCDDATLLGGYLPQYPPLPPSRPAGVEQPHTSSELMLYPGAMAATAYSGPLPGTPHLATAPPQPSSQMMVQTTQYAPNSTLSETPLPAHGGLAPMAGPGPGYGVLAGYSTPNNVVGEGSAGGTEVYNGPSKLDVVVLPQRAPPAKRGPFRNQAERQKTAYTRKIGSCIRCRMQRIRCHTNPEDGDAPCGTCKKVSNTNKVWRLPCLRLKISEVVLSKTGPVKGYEWTRRWKDGMVADEISSWASDEIKTIRVTEGFTGQSVELQVRQFVPQEGDRLERSWVVDGVRRSVKIPAFALVDMDAVRGSYDSYIENGIEKCCNKLVNREKKLLWRTYSLAIRMLADSGLAEEERELLLNTLELWMSIRLTTTSFEIVGDETLGMTHDLMDETSPLNGKIPLPPVMGAQLDSILIHQIQAKFRRDTLDQLQNFTQENRQKTWLTTYLVTFVLLHNIALVIQHDASYARKHGIERRFAREDKVKQYFVGATTLLAYFHYRRYAKPFAPDVKIDDLRANSGNEAADFVVYARKYIQDNETQWRDLLESGEIENEYYFVAQMHDQDWAPRNWPG